MKSTMMPSPLLVTHMLERAGTLFPDVEIVSAHPDGSRTRDTMRGLNQRARRLSAALQAIGLAQGDRVATLMWNEQEHVECYFGVPAVGGVLHTLNMRLHADTLVGIVNHARDRFLIVDDCLLPVLEQMRSRVNFERIFVVNHSEVS